MVRLGPERRRARRSRARARVSRDVPRGLARDARTHRRDRGARRPAGRSTQATSRPSSTPHSRRISRAVRLRSATFGRDLRVHRRRSSVRRTICWRAPWPRASRLGAQLVDEHARAVAAERARRNPCAVSRTRFSVDRGELRADDGRERRPDRRRSRRSARPARHSARSTRGGRSSASRDPRARPRAASTETEKRPRCSHACLVEPGSSGRRRPRRSSCPGRPEATAGSARLAVVPVETAAAGIARRGDARTRRRVRGRRRAGSWRRSRVISRWASEGAHSRGAAGPPRPARRDRGARTRSLRKAYDELRSVDAMKDRFLANVSHEMRSPLDGDHRRRDVPAGLRRRPGGARGDGGGHPRRRPSTSTGWSTDCCASPASTPATNSALEETSRRPTSSPEALRLAGAGRARERSARSRASSRSPPIPRVSRGRSPISWTTRSSSGRPTRPSSSRVAPCVSGDARGARSPAWRSRCSTEGPGVAEEDVERAFAPVRAGRGSADRETRGRRLGALRSAGDRATPRRNAHLPAVARGRERIPHLDSRRGGGRRDDSRGTAML